MVGQKTMSKAGASAIILFAHGSRDPIWHQPMEAVAANIASRAPATPVACAYLELSSPDLPTVVNGFVQAGTSNITILPMFLGVGRHAREDLPKIVSQLQVQHPHVTFMLLPAVGENPRLVHLLADIALESL